MRRGGDFEDKRPQLCLNQTKPVDHRALALLFYLQLSILPPNLRINFLSGPN